MPNSPIEPVHWVVADVSHVFDRVNWASDENRYKEQGRVLWLIVFFADMYVVDADFHRKSLEVWSSHPNPVVMDWIRDQLKWLNNTVLGRAVPLQWDVETPKIYLTEVSLHSAALGVVGRLLKVPGIPTGEKDVTGHLEILPRLRQVLHQDLYPGLGAEIPPAQLPGFATQSQLDELEESSVSNKPG